MAIKVIEYLIVGEAPNTVVTTFYDADSSVVDTEWALIESTGETTSGDSVQYALFYEDVTELAEVAPDVFVRKASSGDPDDYGTLPNLDPAVVQVPFGGTGLSETGTIGQVLAADGNGGLEYITAAGTGTVTSFSAGTTGFSVATATTVPTISGTLNLANGGTDAALVDPKADRMMFWDDSAGAVTWLAPGAGIAITTTTIAITRVPHATPTGAVDGVNTTFTLASSPSGANLDFYINGILQKPTTDYTLATNTITCVVAPAISDILDANYWV